MALISCPECKKEISDKAKNCPQCGYPISDSHIESNEYLACPKCNSRKLHSEKAGFSGKKAVAGAVFTGGIGILAGTIGSKNIYLTCLKCNNRFKAGDALIVREGLSNESFDEKVLDFYKSSNSLLATVKFHHDNTNMPLSESKNYVENLLKRNSIDWKANGNSGCMVTLIMLLIMSIVIISAVV